MLMVQILFESVAADRNSARRTLYFSNYDLQVLHLITTIVPDELNFTVTFLFTSLVLQLLPIIV